MYDVIIVGAGPAGLMAGIKCKKKALILEKNNSAGKKLLITGGGRCNITNNKNNKEFLENIEINKKHLYSTLNYFGPSDIINFFESQNIKLKEENDGKIFPVSNKSYTILEGLLKNYKGEIHFNEEVKKVIKNNENFIIETSKMKYETKKVIIATGGSSYKNTGSTGDNLKFAKKLYQPVVEVYPAEVGVILKRPLPCPGVSFDHIIVSIKKIKKEGSLMITHRGLSGNAIMLLSEYIYKEKAENIIIDFLPKYNEEEIKDQIKKYDREKEIHTFLTKYFTKKFIDYLLEECKINKNTKVKQLDSKQINLVINFIKRKIIEIKSVESIELAYVTGGGIDMKFINSKTMESTLTTGLYFVGESLDIHGPIGGYNLTLALSTGASAGNDI